MREAIKQAMDALEAGDWAPAVALVQEHGSDNDKMMWAEWQQAGLVEPALRWLTDIELRLWREQCDRELIEGLKDQGGPKGRRAVSERKRR
jgi:hypothetical protein